MEYIKLFDFTELFNINTEQEPILQSSTILKHLAVKIMIKLTNTTITHKTFVVLHLTGQESTVSVQCLTYKSFPV
jgi:hypothetical protein